MAANLAALPSVDRLLNTAALRNAQARHGPKLWIVRRISSGCSGLTIGVFSSAASYAPIWPWASRGPAFQVVGTTHW